MADTAAPPLKWFVMIELDTRQMMNAASAAAVERTAAPQEVRPAPKDQKALSAAALAVAAQPTAKAWSPIVLAGFVRMIEFAITVLVGFAIYVAYVVPL